MEQIIEWSKKNFMMHHDSGGSILLDDLTAAHVYWDNNKVHVEIDGKKTKYKFTTLKELKDLLEHRIDS